MLESGSSGSVRGASRNGRPYREPRWRGAETDRTTSLTGGGRVRRRGYQLGAGERQLFASSPSIPW